MEYGSRIKNSSSISSKKTERALGPKSTGKSERKQKQKWDRDLMSIPNITESISGYTFRWDDLKLSLKISRLRIQNNGRVTGEVLITTDAKNMSPILYPQTQLNFSSSTTRQHLINILKPNTHNGTGCKSLTKSPIKFRKWLELESLCKSYGRTMKLSRLNLCLNPF